MSLVWYLHMTTAEGIRRTLGLRAAAASALLLCLPGAPDARAAEPPPGSVLRVSGMTFVGSRGSDNELVLRSESALFRPDRNLAELEQVSAVATDGKKGQTFTLRCDRAELNVETNDFLAEGHVEGETGDGQRYSTAWVRYDRDEGVLYTDAPVTVVDDTGRFRGDGFRYHVGERRFQLLGNVSVVQQP